MEQKSIGSFIAALRRANGMTQKDLAEKLSVSDKAVSRWERDESLPDLMLFPVIADIFHITVDELLRGERKIENVSAPVVEVRATPSETARLKKQTKRILAVQLNRLRNRNCIALGVGAAGVMAAVVCNFAFSQGFVAFCIGLICVSVAASMTALFCQGAWQAADDEEYDAEAIQEYKQEVLRWIKRMTAILVGMLALCLPMGLTIFNNTSYRDVYIGPGNWLRYSAICVASLETLLSLAYWQINKHLLQKKGWAINEHRIEIHGWCVGVLIAVMAVTVFCRMIVPEPAVIARGETFDSVEAFVQEMNRRWEEQKQQPYQNALHTSVEYFDSYGNAVSEEEVALSELYGTDGEVIAQYYKPYDVIGVRHTTYADGRHAISVYDEYDYRKAERDCESRINLCIFLYVLEPLLALIAYQIINPGKRKMDKR